MLGDDLAYVALATRDPEAAAHVLSGVLGLPRIAVEAGAGKTPFVLVGRTALGLFPLGHPAIEGAEKPGVHHIALAARDPAVAAADLAKAGISTTGTLATGPGGKKRIALDPSMTAAVRTYLTEPLDLGTGKADAIDRLDHLGIASADNRVAKDAWVSRARRPLESEQTDMEVAIAVESFTSDKYGVVYHSRPPVPVAGLRVAFITVGDTDLEFLQSFDPRQPGEVDRGAAGTTRQDQGAIARFVASRGGGLHHIAFKTTDIAGRLGALGKAGVPLIDKAGRPGSRRAKIGFIDPKALGGVLAHFVDRPG